MLVKIVSVNGKLLVDSREVAEMVDKQHSHLLRDIKVYADILTESNFGLSEFFIESTYQDSTGRKLPCYLLTRKGCDMVANKMTGEKGVLFTATYVTKFEEMEREQTLDVSLLTPELQMFKHLFDSAAQTQLQLQVAQKELAEVKSTVSTIQETFLKRDEDWRKSINSMLNAAAYRSGGKYQDLRSTSYKMLEERGSCDLNRRLRNMRERMADSGSTKSKIEATGRMDVIEADSRLKEIYTTIIKELSIGTLRIAK